MPDNRPLSRRGRRARPRKAMEAADYAAWARRTILAYGRFVAKTDPEHLVALLALKDVVDEAVEVAVHGIRDSGDYSWTAIGDALGITRQAARQRYHR